MTDTVGVQVEGARQLRASMKRAGQDMTQMNAAHKIASSIVAADAKRRAPVRTGRLAGTIRAAGTRTRAEVRAGFARVPYAGPIHWGWPRKGIRPSLFLTTAAAATEPGWTMAYRAEVERILGQIEGTHV